MLSSERLDIILAELGDHRVTVASRLFKAGCKGYQRHAHECPVANYVRDRLENPHLTVVVDNNTVAVGLDDFTDEWVPDADTWLPEPVIEFIEIFDRGGFWLLAKNGGYRGLPR